MTTDSWRLQQIGAQSYCFIWPTGFYNTVFTLTPKGVIALDPLNREAAAAYRTAIASLTNQPIRWVVYSHDHLDHITGAEILAPNAPIVSHTDVPGLLLAKGFMDIPLPSVLVDSFHRLELGGEAWELLYLGPNHGRCNLAVHNRKERWVALIDVVSAGYVPYRNLPVADFHGFMSALDKVVALDVDLIMDGHCPPASIEWAHNYRRYFRDLLEETRDVRATLDESHILAMLPPGAGGVEMTEAMFQKTAELVVPRLRPKYGEWEGFELWAPQNVDRALVYLITGE